MKKLLVSSLFMSALFIGLISFIPAHAADTGVNIWWPSSGAAVEGVQPFKAVLADTPLDQYYMFWQVGNGGYVMMGNSQQDYPHKEASVDLSGWKWNADGHYDITFIAQDLQGREIARKTVTITHGASISAPAQTMTAIVVPPASSFSLSKLYVSPSSPALAQAELWKYSRPNDALIMQKMGSQPTAVWLGGWNSDVTNDVEKVMDASKQQNAIPTFVAYNIPNRDCGSYSAGGVSSKDAYLSWINKVSTGIGSGEAIVILEPDALPSIDCLSDSAKNDRYAMLSSAIDILSSNAKTHVYLDAGNATWISATEMAKRLNTVGISKASGFSLNVSGFVSTSESTAYGEALSRLVNNKHFVIDTSRNGSGSNGEWCNPSGRTLGNKPTFVTGNPLIDAYLWIKTPGESDGTCNGGPSAGTWWPENALALGRDF